MEYFKLKELCILVLLFAENAKKCQALLDIGKERTREQLDRRFLCETFWNEVIAPIFNDAEVVETHCFNDPIADL